MVGFNLADKFELVERGAFDMVYTIDENEFNGQTNIQIRVLDIKPSSI